MERLGLLSLLERAGAIRVHSAAFISGRNQSPVRNLSDAGAWPFALPAGFHLGAENFNVSAANCIPSAALGRKRILGEGIVRASGRRAQSTENGWRWFGLKAHARNVNLSADLEMHVSADHYVGVNRINGGEVNVCGLFRGRAGRSPRIRL